MASPAYSDSAAYKAHVTSMFHRTDFPSITEAVPAVRATRYHSLGLAVTDAAASTAFYGALGFAPVAGDGPIPVLRSVAGLELHLLHASERVEAGNNILMDYATSKPPGHTHASWSVTSVPAVKALLEQLGVPLSGTRSTLAVFVRDPDRTTLEFERNDGGDEPPAVVSSAMIGASRRLDHVGIRVRAPYDRHLTFYAETLGFSRLVNKYDPNADPLKNFPPWISRTEHNCDINLIINGNTAIPEAGEATEFALITGSGALRPGLLYVAFEIDETDAAAALARLRAAGAEAALDTELPLSFGLPAAAVRLLKSGPSIFMKDLCGTFLRLIPATP